MYQTGRDSKTAGLETGEQMTRGQLLENMKRETRRSLMRVVAKATDVLVKRCPVASNGLPHTTFDYHEKISIKAN